MKMHLTLLLLPLIIISCADSNSDEEIVPVEANLVGNFRTIKAEGEFMGRKTESNNFLEYWRFTEDSLFVYKACILVKKPKKEGKNYFDAGRDYEEEVYYKGDTLIFELEQKRNKVKIIYYLLPSKIVDAQREFDKNPIKIDCLLGEKYVLDGFSTTNNKTVKDSSISTLDTLDFTEENIGNYNFSGYEIAYKYQEEIHLFDVAFLYDNRELRVIPKSDCQCDTIYVDYFVR